MELKQFCDGIGLNSTAQQFIYNYQMNEQLYNKYKADFYNDQDYFFMAIKEDANYRQVLLYLFVRFSIDAYDEYRKKGIEDDIFFHTFSDIEIWCQACYRDYGEYGIEEYNWLQEHVQLRLFRLGRLQFQPLALDRDIAAAGKKMVRNQIVLNVHIPEGEPLDSHLVEESFEQARHFFRGISPVFICNSWLLYPNISEVLSPNSNILKFQKYFHIVDIDHDAIEAEQRIFNKKSMDISAYEERTTLQRKAKAYLLAGNKLGSGYGVNLSARIES